MNDLNEKIVLINDETIAENMVQDINAALMCFISNYRSIIDVNNITLWGYSSGAHIAMLYAYGAFGNTFSAKNRVSAIVSEAGPTYFGDRKVKENDEAWDGNYCRCYLMSAAANLT